MSLQLDDVTVTYADGESVLTALDGVSLTVAPGEVLAVTGPSGSGKSTLLAVAGLLLTPRRGRVVIGGTEVSELGRSERARLRRERLGFVFQQSNLLPALTALEQLLVVSHLNGHKASAGLDRARELLAAVGLQQQSARRPHQLSGGQRQRVGIARALMNAPQVLLVDEPTSALDADRGRTVVELLAGMAHDQGVATIVVTHDTAHLDLVDDVLRMRDGRLTGRTRAGAGAPLLASAGG